MSDNLMDLLQEALVGRRVQLTEEVRNWEGAARPGMFGTVAFVADCEVLPICVDTDEGPRFFCRPSEVKLLPLRQIRKAVQTRPAEGVMGAVLPALYSMDVATFP